MIALLRDAAQAARTIAAGWALDGALLLLRTGRRLTPTRRPAPPALAVVRPAQAPALGWLATDADRAARLARYPGRPIEEAR